MHLQDTDHQKFNQVGNSLTAATDLAIDLALLDTLRYATVDDLRIFQAHRIQLSQEVIHLSSLQRSIHHTPLSQVHDWELTPLVLGLVSIMPLLIVSCCT